MSSRGEEIMRQRAEQEKASIKHAPPKKKVEVFNLKTGESRFVNGVDAREYCTFPDWTTERPGKGKEVVVEYTVAEMKKLLKGAGVEFSPRLKKAELAKLVEGLE
jgi:hypothetical protein